MAEHDHSENLDDEVRGDSLPAGEDVEEEIQRLSQKVADDAERDRRRGLSKLATKRVVAVSLTMGILSVASAVTMTIVNIANPSLLGPGGDGIAPEHRRLGARRLAQEAATRVDDFVVKNGRLPHGVEEVGLSPLEGVSIQSLGAVRYEITVKHGDEAVRLERPLPRGTGGN